MALTLILMRHGHAVADYDSDITRHLSTSGQMQAVQAAGFVRAHGFLPHVILSSDAKRALQSADIVARELNIDNVARRQAHFLYESHTTDDFVDALAQFGSLDGVAAPVLMVVAHNPDLSYRASRLAQDFMAVSFPTAGVLALSFDVSRWEDVAAGSGKVVFSSFC